MKNIGKKTNTIQLLEQYQIKANKKYGQNFLVDENILNRIVQVANIKDKYVIEIGPGLGALTDKLCQEAKHVYAYEIDEKMVRILKNEIEYSNLTIYHEDILKADLSILPDVSYDIVTNIPYYITSDIIEYLLLSDIKINSITALVQKEVAYKYKDEISPLTLLMKESGQYQYCFSVSSNVFIPKPHVESGVFHLTINNKVDKCFYLFIKQAFTQKRKTLINNLKKHYPNIETSIKQIGLTSNLRPHELTLNDYHDLYKEVIKDEN